MDNDDRIVGRILTRREALRAAGLTGLVFLAGCGGGSSSSGSTTSGTTGGTTGGTTSGATGGTTVDLVATPAEIEGPFFVDENLNRSDLVTPGASRSTVAGGTPLTLTLTIYSLSGTTATPLSGAHVDIWHCDTVGVYSDEASGSIQSENTTGQTWLRGYQVSGTDGVVTFNTIVPGWYTGRTTHIHVKIRTYDSAGNKTSEFTTQLFFTDTLSQAIYAANAVYSHGTRTVFNANDNVYSNLQSDGTTVGSHLMPTVVQSGSGYAATFSIALVV